MKIAVIGCGAIGGLFLGYLSESNSDVIGVVREYQKQEILKQGLFIEGVRGRINIHPKVDVRLKEKPDLAILATKINDLEKAVEDNIEYLKDSILLTTQNGIRADYMLKNYVPVEQIITGIVMFGATYLPANKIIHNFPGDLLLGNIFAKEIKELNWVKESLATAFNVSWVDNMIGAKYLKIFINLNNCIPAILGVSMQEAFADLDIAELAIRLNKEAFGIVQKSNIELASLPTYPKERLQALVSQDTKEAARILSKVMTSLSKQPLYGSILQSIKRGRKSEIDYINGQIVGLAQQNGLSAPLNERIVQLVHKVQEQTKFFNKDELLSAINV